jgi:hypothetical protein
MNIATELGLDLIQDLPTIVRDFHLNDVMVSFASGSASLTGDYD